MGFLSNLFAFINIVSLIALAVFIVMTVWFAIKDKPRVRKGLNMAAIALGIFIISVFGIVVTTAFDEDYEAEQALRAEAKAEEKEKELKIFAEAEAKAKVEQEAKEKAAAEQKIIDEAEAKKKAEEDAKLKAEQEKKDKAAAEVKAKEDAAAKKKAEEDAKIAEAEAKKKAEAAAKAKEEQAEKDRLANMQTVPFAQLNKNPDKYTGENSKYTGEILEIQESDGYGVMRLAVTPTSYGYDYNDVIWVEYEGETDFVEEDIVTIYGMVLGSHSYTSQAGWEISIPSMFATDLE